MHEILNSYSDLSVNRTALTTQVGAGNVGGKVFEMRVNQGEEEHAKEMVEFMYTESFSFADGEESFPWFPSMQFG